jgi:hypothetical protein
VNAVARQAKQHPADAAIAPRSVQQPQPFPDLRPLPIPPPLHGIQHPGVAAAATLHTPAATSPIPDDNLCVVVIVSVTKRRLL